MIFNSFFPFIYGVESISFGFMMYNLDEDSTASLKYFRRQSWVWGHGQSIPSSFWIWKESEEDQNATKHNFFSYFRDFEDIILSSVVAIRKKLFRVSMWAWPLCTVHFSSTHCWRVHSSQFLSVFLVLKKKRQEKKYNVHWFVVISSCSALQIDPCGL